MRRGYGENWPAERIDSLCVFEWDRARRTIAVYAASCWILCRVGSVDWILDLPGFYPRRRSNHVSARAGGSLSADARPPFQQPLHRESCQQDVPRDAHRIEVGES